jgi:hypothetical protein
VWLVLIPSGSMTTDKAAGGGARAYSDEKVANRDTKVWHLVIENGY